MSKEVQGIYSDIYKHYDTVNVILSFGTMRLWRRVVAREAVRDGKRHTVLDIATGTGELAFEMANAAGRDSGRLKIIGVDFNSKMLQVARMKGKEKGSAITFELGDALSLKYANGSFDLVTSGFGLKNLDDLQKFSDQVHRVLKSGGRFVFLDMATPDSKFARMFIGAYWAAIGAVCKIIGKESYVSILGSINDFDKPGFVKMLKDSGFKDVRISKPTFGPAFLITGRK